MRCRRVILTLPLWVIRFVKSAVVSSFPTARAASGIGAVTTEPKREAAKKDARKTARDEETIGTICVGKRGVQGCKV